MKIAHIVCVFPPYKGGIGKSAHDFASMMSSVGNEVDIYTPLYSSFEAREEYSKLKIHRVKSFFKLGNGAFIPRLFFELKKYDLIYLHYPFFGGAEIVWLFGIFNKKTKIILHYHMDVMGLSLLFRILSIPSKLIERKLLKRADLITVGSLDYLEGSQIKNYYTRNKEKFRETFFPVDTEKFYLRSGNKNLDIKSILFVGGLDKAHYFKGLNVLIDALSQIKERTDWKLQIVGRGELIDEYKERCQKVGIDDRVQFLNSVSDEELPSVYRESDFFVLPSINKGEAFGIVLLEALSSGLPVIASNLAGVRSVFSSKEGFLVVPDDKNDLRIKIEKMLDNNELLKKMSVNSRELAEEKYSYKSVRRKINNIVDELEK